ncbi:MAG: glycosyltransferase family 4 protein [Candidatus Verstraetearchaeota archaeon]|nr:glycosyltransferase family 4 protein [Candidatus Verstraetearchaeota archaeon]
MDILMVNHRDIYHPQAGGAEVVLYEVGRRLAKKANVTWLAESVKGRGSEEIIEGIKVKRRGNKYTLHLYSLIEAKKHEIVLDSVAHAAPFFSYKVNRNAVAMVHHVHQDVLKFEVDPLQATFLKALEKRVRDYDNIIAVSNTTKRDLSKLGVNEEKIHVIYNGVDHEKYKPSEKSEKPMILWIGRMKKYKNPFDSLKIYKRLTKKAEMVVVGGGDLTEEFAKISKKVGVKYLGKVTEEEKVKLYQKAWVVLSTSYIEGWGMTVVEANACGTPVVAYATGSMPEIIRDGVNGFLVPYKDYDYAAKVIDEILEEDKMKELSKRSLKESMKYNWEKTADEYMKYLSRL